MINVQTTYSDINLGSQGMIVTNQGVAIQPGFSSKTICSFENRPIGFAYKTGTKYASKDEIELAGYFCTHPCLIFTEEDLEFISEDIE